MWRKEKERKSGVTKGKSEESTRVDMDKLSEEKSRMKMKWKCINWPRAEKEKRSHEMKYEEMTRKGKEWT